MAVARHLPAGRSQAGDRHLNFHENRDNLAQVTAIGADQWSDYDATVFFWVRKSRLPDGLDRALLDSLVAWFEREWSFKAPVIVTNEHFDQQVAMIEGTDLRRRFEVKLPDDPGRYLAYA